MTKVAERQPFVQAREKERQRQRENWLVSIFGSVIRALNDKKRQQLDSSKCRIQCNFLIKYFLAVVVCVCAFCRRFAFDWWHCGARNCVKWHIIWENMVEISRLQHNNCDVCVFFFYFSLHSIWQQNSNTISTTTTTTKIIFYGSISVEKATTPKVTDKHMPTQQNHFINMLSEVIRLKSNHSASFNECHGQPFTISNLSHISRAPNLMHVRSSNTQYVSIRAQT